MAEFGNQHDRRRIQLTKNEQKQVVKEAIQEWLDVQFAQFGKYSLGACIAFAFAVMLYLYLSAHGMKGI